MFYMYISPVGETERPPIELEEWEEPVEEYKPERTQTEYDNMGMMDYFDFSWPGPKPLPGTPIGLNSVVVSPYYDWMTSPGIIWWFDMFVKMYTFTFFISSWVGWEYAKYYVRINEM